MGKSKPSRRASPPAISMMVAKVKKKGMAGIPCAAIISASADQLAIFIKPLRMKMMLRRIRATRDGTAWVVADMLGCGGHGLLPLDERIVADPVPCKGTRRANRPEHPAGEVSSYPLGPAPRSNAGTRGQLGKESACLSPGLHKESLASVLSRRALALNHGLQSCPALRRQGKRG